MVLKLMFKNDMEQAKGLKMDLQFFAEPDPGAGTPPTGQGSVSQSAGTVDQTSQSTSYSSGQSGQSQPASSGAPNDPQAMLRAMNEAQRQAAEARKTLETYQKYGNPDELGQRLGQLEYIEQNTQAVIEDYVTRNPQIFNVLAQKIGPQAAFQAIGQQMFGQQQQDPFQKYQDITDPAELARTMYGDMRQEFQQILKQELQQVAAPVQQLQTNAQRMAVETKLDLIQPRLQKLGITKEQVMQTIEAQKMPYGVVTSTPFLFEAAITQTAGGLDKVLELSGSAAVQTRQQEILNNFQTTPTLTPGGGVHVGETFEPITDNFQLNKAGHDMLSQIIAQTKT